MKESNKEKMYQEHDLECIEYEHETYGRTVPSVRRQEADRIRRRDLAYEYGGYAKIRNDEWR